MSEDFRNENDDDFMEEPMTTFGFTQRILYFLAPALAWVAPVKVYAQDYTKCAVQNPESSGLDLCLPLVNGTSEALQFVRDPLHNTLVAVVPVKNCRAPSTNVRGGLSLAIDNSASMRDDNTDPTNLRLDAAATILRNIQSNALAQLNGNIITTGSVDFPRVSAISYGGRQTIVESNTVYESDGLNIKKLIEYCKPAEGVVGTGNEEAYPNGRTRWSQTATGSTTLISRCELLKPFLASTSSSASSTIPGIERTIDFLTYTGQTPRGSTDLTYIFQAFSRSDMLAGSGSTARNAILITDGLPNIPKRVPKSTCKEKSYLRKEEILTSESGVEYCSDRQFRIAANSANAMLEDYTNFKYDTINLYTILFLGENGKGHIDIDDEGQLNPADFLIEASARTGNGKVKFKIARSATDLADYLASLYTSFSNTAVQRVEIKVNNNPTYTAVSPGAPDKLFSLKFINLRDGANTVTVTTHYTDQSITKTYSINVATTGAPTSPYECTTADGTKTVDGDDPTDKTPKGDGVLPTPKSDGSGDRVYRNDDPVNELDPDDFNLVDDDNESVRAKVESKRLRLQGGTGNCGVISGLADTQASKWWLVFMMLPVFVVGLMRYLSRKKLISFFLLNFFVSAALPSAEASGLNSENFMPAIGRSSPLLWENSERISQGGFIYGYTFDYSYHPVEFGDGSSERIEVSDHLQVNHFSIGYGLFPFLNIGFDVPISLYSAPSTVDETINLPQRNRNTFFLGDMGVYAKLTPRFTRGDWWSGALLLHLGLPTGSTEAMLSDDTLKITLYSPWDFEVADRWEPFLGLGVSFWQTSTRVESEFLLNDDSKILLQRTRSLLLNTGLRYWLKKEDSGARGIKLEVGLRTDSSEFLPSFGNNESPIEWAAGGAWYMNRNWSFHGSYGTGLGRGVGAPMSRLVAGVRYTGDDAYQEEDSDEMDSDSMLSSESMSESELDRILSRGQSETMPPRLEENDSMLRLMTVRDEVFDLGTVRFEFNSSRLTAEAKRTVRKLYDYLRRFRPNIVRIDGHTDSVGSYNYNLALSLRRAQSVKEELGQLGWPMQTISTEGFSYKYPVVSNATKAGRAQNRRIEVALDGKSFRKSSYSTGEKRQFREWISPGGRKPTSQND